MILVNATILLIMRLHEKLEIAHFNHNALQTLFEELSGSIMNW